MCAGGGAPVWSILLSVVVAVAVVGAAAYGLYQFRLRSAMHQVRRASSMCLCCRSLALCLQPYDDWRQV